MSALDSFRLDGRVAVVTGSTRGIGRAAALALADAGADILVTGRDAAAAADVVAEIQQRGRRAHSVLIDLTEDGAPERIIAEAEQQLGAVDVLVNNAGICRWKPALDITADELHEVMNTNVGVTLLMCQAAARRMRSQGSGVIVNVGSISGFIVNRPQEQASYNASKAAIHQLTRSLAVEWADMGIRVNAIAPGYVKTGIAPIDDPEYAPWWVDLAPQRRYALPEELGPSIVYLASDASSFMTGAILTVDGGYSVP
ncbi:MAG: glucose 1-dehydrogenase [Candidatus Nanopelagicales bacterium]|nr:glucose 1-dehydrogenase [Candidatus Nanopelagicales bacterium]MCF8537131.1 glucose 1-dehydrogenase [Candidatus Nanopelagicales bacterium]MCF8542160.1 glucose 1-dehydrogenase [Candidatus Nanopelagicales bacterium]MCF8556953.1 glucose 1-dehydrogenase [Candidatus Nanopelagicales bacterium]